jgi:hypothetical protein
MKYIEFLYRGIRCRIEIYSSYVCGYVYAPIAPQNFAAHHGADYIEEDRIGFHTKHLSDRRDFRGGSPKYSDYVASELKHAVDVYLNQETVPA